MKPLQTPASTTLLCDPDRLADRFADLASQAGAMILTIYNSDFAVRRKADASPVCEADEAAEKIILAGLKELLPDIPVIAEESVAKGIVPQIGTSPFLLVDPLDGTLEFAGRNGEFTVNIALIERGMPVAGIVYAPIDGTLYLGGTTARRAVMPAGSRFDAAMAEPIATRQASDEPVIAVSRSHACAATKRWAEERHAKAVITRGSALKFGLVAEGLADLYPRFTPTMEWDTAAGHAVVRAAGGDVTGPAGEPFVYGKAEAGFRNGPFIARGR